MTQRLFIIFTLFLLTRSALPQSYERSIITDPGISRRCRELLKKRDQKIQQKQRLNTLIIRNQRLQQVAPSERQTVIKKLQKNLRHLRQELELSKIKIKNQEENIVRQGCPGIVL